MTTKSNRMKSSRSPWSYEYHPYTMRASENQGYIDKDVEIPAFEVCDRRGTKLFDTNENLPRAVQEANAKLAAAAPKMLRCLIECARLLADYDVSLGEEGRAYRRAVAIIEQLD